MHAMRFAQAQGRMLFVLDVPASGNQLLLAQGARRLDPAYLKTQKTAAIPIEWGIDER